MQMYYKYCVHSRTIKVHELLCCINGCAMRIEGKKFEFEAGYHRLGFFDAFFGWNGYKEAVFANWRPKKGALFQLNVFL